jgi:hypothetical protein
MREAYSRTAAASSISSRDVALEIYKAATDGSRRLRYFIGVDSRGFLNAKQTLPDQEYIEFIRSYFRSGEGALSTLRPEICDPSGISNHRR